MTDGYVNFGGSWTKIKKLYAKQIGSWIPVKKGFIRDGGIWKMFFQSTVVIDVVSTLTNFNLYDAVAAELEHTPVEAIEVLLSIHASGILGATSTADYALTIGQFPAGSNIVVANSGQILGAGGQPNGGAGGNAIKADFPDQLVTLNNHAGATIYAGGGAGGQGGTGGVGGTGAGYIYSSIHIAEVGGAGGIGGGGGIGGRGIGFGGVNTAGSVGAAGSSGQPGDPGGYAAGGSGGQGGTGGLGGGWGAAGGTGATGNTGAYGLSSRSDSGKPGGAGTAGAPGGRGGYYLVKGTASVIFNNNGFVAGGVA